MDLKTGNKLEGARPGRRRLNADGVFGSIVRQGLFVALDCNLARSSRLRVQNGAGLMGGRGSSRLFWAGDGSHAPPAEDMSGAGLDQQPEAVDDTKQQQQQQQQQSTPRGHGLD